MTRAAPEKVAESLGMSFEEFLEDSPACAYVKDQDGRYVWVNRNVEALLRRSREQLRGLRDEDFLPPEEAAALRRNDRQVLELGDTVTLNESFTLPDGTRRTYLTHKFPIDAGGQRFVGGMAIDITAQRLAEDALRAADKRKDEFLATLSHELRNPLAAAANGVRLLRDAGLPRAAHDQAIDLVDRQVAQITALVDDLLDVARISSGKLHVRPTALELAALVRGAIDVVRPLLEARGHSLDLRLPEATVWFEGDRIRLEQVLVNLVTNAAKYTPKDGHIAIEAHAEPPGIVISVRDDGMGLAPWMIPRVFDLFAQVDGSHPDARGGLGIGLTLARQLVELHGGQIEARSEGLGHGSEFIVRLPLFQA